MTKEGVGCIEGGGGGLDNGGGKGEHNGKEKGREGTLVMTRNTTDSPWW